jgi:3-hydroxymyristoyl/3-hydroxydecanoyl-(acyl carrier protein) dehydratase
LDELLDELSKSGNELLAPQTFKAAWRVEFPDGIPSEERFFDGHFPDQPIVPGAILLGYAAAQLSARGFTIKNILRIKFALSLKPNHPFTIIFLPGAKTLTVLWLTGEKLLARARMGLRLDGE